MKTSLLFASMGLFLKSMLGLISMGMKKKETEVMSDFEKISSLENAVKPLKGSMKIAEWNRQVELRKQLKKTRRENANLLNAEGAR